MYVGVWVQFGERWRNVRGGAGGFQRGRGDDALKDRARDVQYLNRQTLVGLYAVQVQVGAGMRRMRLEDVGVVCMCMCVCACHCSS